MFSTNGPVQVTELHTPSIVSPQGDIHLSSSGDVRISVPGSSTVMRSDGERGIVIDTEETALSIRTPNSDVTTDDFVAEASDSLSYRTLAGATGDSSTLDMTRSGGLEVKTDASGGPASAFAADSASVTLTSTAPDESVQSSVLVDDSGRIEGRAARHVFTVAGDPVLQVSSSAATIHKDVQIQGTLNTVSGTLNALNVEDPTIRLATTAQQDTDIADGAGVGIQIQTVPAAAADTAFVSAFTADDGTPIFLDDQGAVDTERARGTSLFDKEVVFNVNEGARTGGLRTNASRLDEPSWDIGGGALRLERAIPDVSTPGSLVKYEMDLRIADDGTFEVGRIKTSLAWDAGLRQYTPTSPPEFALMKEAIIDESMRVSTLVIAWTPASGVLAPVALGRALGAGIVSAACREPLDFALRSAPSWLTISSPRNGSPVLQGVPPEEGTVQFELVATGRESRYVHVLTVSLTTEDVRAQWNGPDLDLRSLFTDRGQLAVQVDATNPAGRAVAYSIAEPSDYAEKGVSVDADGRLVASRRIGLDEVTVRARVSSGDLVTEEDRTFRVLAADFLNTKQSHRMPMGKQLEIEQPDASRHPTESVEGGETFQRLAADTVAGFEGSVDMTSGAWTALTRFRERGSGALASAAGAFIITAPEPAPGPGACAKIAIAPDDVAYDVGGNISAGPGWATVAVTRTPSTTTMCVNGISTGAINPLTLSAAADNFEAQHLPSHALDTLDTTFWSTPAGNTKFPQHFTITLDGPCRIKAVRYKPVPGPIAADHVISNYEIHVSEECSSFPRDPASSGAWAKTLDWKVAEFAPRTARTVRLVIKDNHSGNQQGSVGASQIVLVPADSPAAAPAPALAAPMYVPVTAGYSRDDPRPHDADMSHLFIHDSSRGQRQLRAECLATAIGVVASERASVQMDTADTRASQPTLAIASSEDTGRYAALNVLDGNPATFWHTRLDGSDPKPHHITIRLGRLSVVSGLRYLPRQSGANGTIRKWAVFVSEDGVYFPPEPVAAGQWSNNKDWKDAAFAPRPIWAIRLQSSLDWGDTGGGSPHTSAALISVVIDDADTGTFETSVDWESSPAELLGHPLFRCVSAAELTIQARSAPCELTAFVADTGVGLPRDTFQWTNVTANLTWPGAPQSLPQIWRAQVPANTEVSAAFGEGVLVCAARILGTIWTSEFEDVRPLYADDTTLAWPVSDATAAEGSTVPQITCDEPGSLDTQGRLRASIVGSRESARIVATAWRDGVRESIERTIPLLTLNTKALYSGSRGSAFVEWRERAGGAAPEFVVDDADHLYQARFRNQGETLDGGFQLRATPAGVSITARLKRYGTQERFEYLMSNYDSDGSSVYVGFTATSLFLWSKRVGQAEIRKQDDTFATDAWGIYTVTITATSVCLYEDGVLRLQIDHDPGTEEQPLGQAQLFKDQPIEWDVSHLLKHDRELAGGEVETLMGSLPFVWASPELFPKLAIGQQADARIHASPAESYALRSLTPSKWLKLYNVRFHSDTNGATPSSTNIYWYKGQGDGDAVFHDIELGLYNRIYCNARQGSNRVFRIALASEGFFYPANHHATLYRIKIATFGLRDMPSFPFSGGGDKNDSDQTWILFHGDQSEKYEEMSIANFLMPSGLAFDNSNGKVSGSPLIAGEYKLAARATSFADATLDREFTLNIARTFLKSGAYGSVPLVFKTPSPADKQAAQEEDSKGLVATFRSDDIFYVTAPGDVETEVPELQGSSSISIVLCVRLIGNFTRDAVLAQLHFVGTEGFKYALDVADTGTGPVTMYAQGEQSSGAFSTRSVALNEWTTVGAILDIPSSKIRVCVEGDFDLHEAPLPEGYVLPAIKSVQVRKQPEQHVDVSDILVYQAPLSRDEFADTAMALHIDKAVKNARSTYTSLAQGNPPISRASDSIIDQSLGQLYLLTNNESEVHGMRTQQARLRHFNMQITFDALWSGTADALWVFAYAKVYDGGDKRGAYVTGTQPGTFEPGDDAGLAIVFDVYHNEVYINQRGSVTKEATGVGFAKATASPSLDTVSITKKGNSLTWSLTHKGESASYANGTKVLASEYVLDEPVKFGVAAWSGGRTAKFAYKNATWKLTSPLRPVWNMSPLGPSLYARDTRTYAVEGNPLPNLSLTTAGALTGRPATSGTYQWTVRATSVDCTSVYTDRTYEVVCGDVSGTFKQTEYDGYWADNLAFFDTAPILGSPTYVDRIRLLTVPSYKSFTWIGSLVPPSTADFTFYIQADDACQMYLDDVLTVDIGGTHPLTEKRATVSLVQGTVYRIAIYYGNSDGDSGMYFTWSGPGIERQYSLAGFGTRGWGSNLTIAHPDGRVLKRDNAAIRLDTGSDVKFAITQPSSVRNVAYNRVAFSTGVDQFVRHLDYSVVTAAYAAGNVDFAWRFIRNDSTGLWDLYNDFSSGHWLGYDAAADQLRIVSESDTRRVSWNITPEPMYRYTVDFTPE